MCSSGTVSLQCNAKFTGKTLVMVQVPAKWDQGESQEKTRIINAYQSAFSMCKGSQQSVAVLARQSPGIALRLSVKGVLRAAFDTFSEPSPTTTCKSVVIYTDSPSANQEVCKIVHKGLPPGWNSRPSRGNILASM